MLETGTGPVGRVEKNGRGIMASKVALGQTIFLPVANAVKYALDKVVTAIHLG